MVEGDINGMKTLTPLEFTFKLLQSNFAVYHGPMLMQCIHLRNTTLMRGHHCLVVTGSHRPSKHVFIAIRNVLHMVYLFTFFKARHSILMFRRYLVIPSNRAFWLVHACSLISLTCKNYFAVMWLTMPCFTTLYCTTLHNLTVYCHIQRSASKTGAVFTICFLFSSLQRLTNNLLIMSKGQKWQQNNDSITNKTSNGLYGCYWVLTKWFIVQHCPTFQFICFFYTLMKGN